MQTEEPIKNRSYKYLSEYARYFKNHMTEAIKVHHAIVEEAGSQGAAFNDCFIEFIALLANEDYEAAGQAWYRYLYLCDAQKQLSTASVIEMKHKAKNFLFSLITGFTDNVIIAVGVGNEVADFLHKADLQVDAKFRLQESERLYRQAEELANIGNWKWNIQTGKVEWTDHLFTIYGMEPQSETISIDTFLSFIHPEDKEQIADSLSIAEGAHHLDFTFRIITRQGQVKTLHSLAKVEQRDEDGRPLIMVGTEKDITEKQLLIDKLKESETLYKQAQALAHIGNWTLDLATGNIEWSDELYRIYGLEPQSEKIDLDRYISLMQYDNPQAARNRLAEYIRLQKPYEFYHTLTVNGKPRHIHSHGEIVLNKKGEPVQLVGTAQDVTETHLIEQELKGNQNLISKIADAAPSSISSYNIKTGKYTYVNQGMEKLLGYTVEEIMQGGQAFTQSLIHPDDAAQMAGKPEQAKLKEPADNSKDSVQEATYRIKNRNGVYKWVHTYETVFDRDDNGNIEHILNITMDVTAQMEATAIIKEQEHFIQQIADSSPTILYLYDVDQQSIVYINREIYFVLGYLPEEIIEKGDDVTQLIYHPEDLHLLPGRKGSGKTFQQVDSMIQYECRIKNKEGEWRWLLIREIVFKTDESGNIKQILGAALDINHRKEMERTIIQNSALLEQSNASLEEFAYVASHDLKEPLRKISTFGDRLVATQLDKLTGDGKVYLKKIVDASQRMQTMISDLLSISMIKGNTSFEQYSLQKILDETLQTLEFKIEQQSAVIKSDPLPEATIIPSQFRQLFQNLLSNSLKFIHPDKQPEITIRHRFVDKVELLNSKAERYHKIEIRDNGIGFEPEFAGKIFAIFQRLHGRSEYEGSGIGLAICKKIVEHHGGIIYADGKPGEGATFTIILPQ